MLSDCADGREQENDSAAPGKKKKKKKKKPTGAKSGDAQGTKKDFICSVVFEMSINYI